MGLWVLYFVIISLTAHHSVAFDGKLVIAPRTSSFAPTSDEYVVPVHLLSGGHEAPHPVPLPSPPREDPSLPVIAMVVEAAGDRSYPGLISRVASRVLYPNAILALVVSPDSTEHIVKEYGHVEYPGLRVFTTDRVFETVSICLDADIYVFPKWSDLSHPTFITDIVSLMEASGADALLKENPGHPIYLLALRRSYLWHSLNINDTSGGLDSFFVSDPVKFMQATFAAETYKYFTICDTFLSVRCVPYDRHIVPSFGQRVQLLSEQSVMTSWKFNENPGHSVSPKLHSFPSCFEPMLPVRLSSRLLEFYARATNASYIAENTKRFVCRGISIPSPEEHSYAMKFKETLRRSRFINHLCYVLEGLSLQPNNPALRQSLLHVTDETALSEDAIIALMPILLSPYPGGDACEGYRLLMSMFSTPCFPDVPRRCLREKWVEAAPDLRPFTARYVPSHLRHPWHFGHVMPHYLRDHGVFCGNYSIARPVFCEEDADAIGVNVTNNIDGDPSTKDGINNIDVVNVYNDDNDGNGVHDANEADGHYGDTRTMPTADLRIPFSWPLVAVEHVARLASFGTWIRGRQRSGPAGDGPSEQLWLRTPHDVFSPTADMNSLFALSQGRKKPLWIHFFGDSRLRDVFFSLAGQLTGFEPEAMQKGLLKTRLANPHRSGCWSRLCSGDMALRFGLTYFDCLNLHTRNNFTSSLHEIEVPWEAFSYTVPWMMNEYSCMFEVAQSYAQPSNNSTSQHRSAQVRSRHLPPSSLDLMSEMRWRDELVDGVGADGTCGDVNELTGDGICNTSGHSGSSRSSGDDRPMECAAAGGDDGVAGHCGCRGSAGDDCGEKWEYTTEAGYKPVGPRVRITQDTMLMYQWPSLASSAYVDALFSNPRFTPDVFVVGPAHDTFDIMDRVSYVDSDVVPDVGSSGPDGFWLDGGAGGVGGATGDRTLEGSLWRTNYRVLQRGVEEFFGKMRRWKDSLSPHTRILVLDTPPILENARYSKDVTQTNTASLWLASFTENLSKQGVIEKSPRIPFNDGRWFLRVPLYDMMHSDAIGRTSSHLFDADGIHFKSDVNGVLSNVIISSVTRFGDFE